MERMPADIKKMLQANKKAQEAWVTLTSIAQYDFIRWVTSAKLKETRVRRTERMSDMLAKGKRRPCCYSVVPTGLYAALPKVPKAKAAWSALTPEERRKIVQYVDEGENKEAHQKRIKEVLAKLSKGKR